MRDLSTGPYSNTKCPLFQHKTNRFSNIKPITVWQIRISVLYCFHNVTFECNHFVTIRSIQMSTTAKKKELLEYIRTENKQVYRKLRHSLFGRVMNLPGRGGRKMSVAAYKISQKFYGFNWCVKASHPDIGFGKIFYEIVITVKKQNLWKTKMYFKDSAFFKSF